jgi:hypothetical protein
MNYKLSLVAFVLMYIGFAVAQHPDPPDHTRDTSDAQRTMDNNMANAKEVTERQAQEAHDKEMRDTSSDGRLEVSPSTSVGGNVERTGNAVTGASVNVQTQVDRPHPQPPDHSK